jgi:hypothetical protein
MTLSPLASRIVAWGLLANMCWAMAIFVAGPLLNQMNADRETIASSRELLDRYRRLEAALPLIQAQLNELRGRTDSGRYFFPPSSPALTVAEMQNAVQRLVSGSGVVMRSSKTLPAAVEKGFDRVGVDLEITASTAGLAFLLRAIAKSEPVILVDRVQAQVPETEATTTAPDGQPSIGVTLRLLSYARSGGTGAKS